MKLSKGEDDRGKYILFEIDNYEIGCIVLVLVAIIFLILY